MALGFVASLTYLTCASGAFGPAGDLPSVDASAPQIELAKASLSYSGADPVITGSVDHLFATASFMGPNRGEKSDRYRPAVDVLAVSRSFEEVWVRLAALRASPLKAAAE